MSTFADFDVHPDIRDALTEAGITTPFPIQETTLPLALSGADVIGQARTGTGKTFAFGVPLLQGLGASDGVPQGLVIVPTRELCVQVRDDLAKLGARLDVSVVAVYGGRPIQPQADALKAGAEVVVGTPGRLLDLVGRGMLDLSQVSTLVLDEADEMLDLGFLPDVERLISSVPEQRQTMLFSATMPGAIVSLARRYMNKPTFLRGDVEEAGPPPETAQHFLACHRMDKPAVLARILQSPDRGRTLVFTRTKRMADVLASELTDRGVSATPIHSDLRQESREAAMKRFRSGAVDVLVATEVAARGLDISEITHVVNYDCPEDEKMYLHRIGRTGRAGAAGVAITLGTWNELARLDAIKNALGVDSPTHEAYSTSPILDELFNLPPRAERSGSSGQPSAKSSSRARRGAKTGSKKASRGERPTAANETPGVQEGSGARSGAQEATGADEQAATDGEAPGRAGSDRSAESGTPRRRRSRRRSSGRKPTDRSTGPAGPAEEQPTTGPTAEETTTGPAEEQPTAGPAEEQPTAGPAEEPATEETAGPTAEETTTGPAGEGEDAPVRRRVRTRSRSRGTGPSQDEPGTAGGEEKPQRADEAQPAAKAPTQGKDKRGKAAGRGKGRSRSGSQTRSRSERSARSGRSQTPSGVSRNGQPPDVAAARGSGRPALRRPMVVTHLP